MKDGERKPTEVEFYYGLGSRYSYLASTQIERLEAETGCRVIWLPLYSADLMARAGRDPFAGEPTSGQYDWAYRERDASAWADYYGVPFLEPRGRIAFDPREAALACLAAGAFDATASYSRRVFQAIFAERRTSLDQTAYGRLAAELGLDGERLLALIADPETSRRHAAHIDQALTRGAFGVPTFHVRAAGQSFFGNDRLPLLRHCLRALGTAV
jgi:2-hydroxychromene-2-carboxylate isomerase